MFNLFLILHALLAIVLILSVLVQRSDGGALGGLGGGSANFSGMLMLMIRRSPARCLAMMWFGSYLFNKLTISIAFYLLITKK